MSCVALVTRLYCVSVSYMTFLSCSNGTEGKPRYTLCHAVSNFFLKSFLLGSTVKWEANYDAL